MAVKEWIASGAARSARAGAALAGIRAATTGGEEPLRPMVPDSPFKPATPL